MTCQQGLVDSAQHPTLTETHAGRRCDIDIIDGQRETAQATVHYSTPGLTNKEDADAQTRYTQVTTV